jgi:hypothetical protein
MQIQCFYAIIFDMNTLKKVLDKQKNNLIQYLLDFIMVLLPFGGFFRDGFGNDTLIQLVYPLAGINTWYTNGRYLAYALSYALYRAGFTATDHYKICYLLFIALLALSIQLLQKTLHPFADGFLTTPLREAGFYAATGLVYCNVLFTEDFMFTECFLVYPFAYFFATLAIYLIIARNRKWSGLICMIIASLFYQVALIQAAMILATCFVLREKLKLSKKLVLQEISSALVIIGIIAVNYISMKILSFFHITYMSAKDAGIGTSLKDKIQFLISQTGQYLESSLQLLPPLYLPLLVFLCFLIPLAVYLLKRKEKNEIVTLFLLFLLLNGFVVLIPFVQTPMGFNPRIVFTFYTEQCMFFILALCYSGEHIKKIICSAACGWLVIQMVFCNVIMANHYLSNQLDLTYGHMVYNKVLNYEQETGTQITKFAVVNDTNSPHTYDEVEYKRDQINERVLSIEPYCLFMYISGRNDTEIVRVDMDPQIYDTYFKDKNWDYFDPEQQVIIKGDTVYWCVF